jgi:hypothetical protein
MTCRKAARPSLSESRSLPTTNSLRAREGLAALQAYRDAGGDEDTSCPSDKEAMVGLVAALLHLCDEQDWNFDRLLKDGRDAYASDCGDDGWS